MQGFGIRIVQGKAARAVAVVLVMAAPYAGATAAEPLGLPLLGPGKHLGHVHLQEGATPEARERIRQAHQTALEHGMSVSRIQSDWVALETGPGEYQKDAIEAQMKAFHEQGLQFMVTISTLDTGELTLPPDLEDPDDQMALAGGMNIDDPKVVARYLALLDWVVPMMTEYGGFLVSVANEPDTMFEEHPEYIEGLANLIAASRDHVRTINPDMAVSATLTGHAFRPGGDWAEPLLDECDVAIFNYYGLNPATLKVEDFDHNWSFLDKAGRLAGDKEYIIQEWGVPSGYEDRPSPINGSLEKQREYFARTAEVMLAHPRFRAAFVFELVDWSPETTEWMSDLLTETVAEDEQDDVSWVPLLEEWLLTTGLLRDGDGSAKPAWEGYLNSLETLAESRRELREAAAGTR